VDLIMVNIVFIVVVYNKCMLIYVHLYVCMYIVGWRVNFLMSTFTAAKVAVDKLSADVRAKKIPDISGGSGRLSYGVSK